jgi:hypothetical protein
MEGDFPGEQLVHGAGVGNLEKLGALFFAQSAFQENQAA